MDHRTEQRVRPSALQGALDRMEAEGFKITHILPCDSVMTKHAHTSEERTVHTYTVVGEREADPRMDGGWEVLRFLAQPGMPIRKWDDMEGGQEFGDVVNRAGCHPMAVGLPPLGKVIVSVLVNAYGLDREPVMDLHQLTDNLDLQAAARQLLSPTVTIPWEDHS